MTIRINNDNDYALDRLHKMSVDNSFTVTSPDEVLKNYRKLTIDKFIVFLYSLLRNNEMILEDPQKGIGPKDRNKFSFTEIYPDYGDITNTHNNVTFEIWSRAPATLKATAVSANSTKWNKPRILFEKKMSDGDTYEFKEFIYENILKFTVWSEKADDARRLATSLENFFADNYHLLRMHVGGLYYEGRSQTILSSDFGTKRLFGIPLVYKVITEEPGYTRRGNIVSIDTSLQIVDSLLNEELEELQQRINKN